MISWNAWKQRLCIALLLGAASMQAAIAGPVLSMTATPNPATLGSTISVDVKLDDIADLYAHQFSLSFNAALFQATGGAEGSFLQSGGATTFDAGVIDNAGGSIAFVYSSLLGAVPGVSGSGVLAHFTFDVIGAGAGLFHLSDVLFLDSGFGDLALQVQDLTVQANAGTSVPEPAAFWLMGLGLVGLGVMRRRRA
jgi:hypothetical protein